MKNLFTIGAALLATTSIATAGGLDRSGQGVGIIFEDGNVVELSYGHVDADLTGQGTTAFGGQPSGDIAPAYTQIGLGVKVDVNEALSFAVFIDQPFGADVAYTQPTYPLNGVAAQVESKSLNILGRYKFDGGLSVHGGLRYYTVSGTLTNIQPGGYTANMEDANAVAPVLGVAYERPEIALRVALTYTGEADVSMNTTNNFGPDGSTDVTLPSSINLDFQTGVAADTLVFGSIRFADYKALSVTPPNYGTVLEYENNPVTYSLGVGRRFSETLSGAVTLGYEASQGGAASNLAPTDGNISLGLGLTYTMDNVKITGGVRYVQLGDTFTEHTSGATFANFNDNTATAIGLKVSYGF